MLHQPVDTGEPADLFVIAGSLCFHLPIKVVLCPKQAHLVSAIAHDGGGGPCPQPQYPVLFGHCHCTMNGTLQKGRLSEHDCMASCKCASNSQNQPTHSSPHTIYPTIYPIYNLPPICASTLCEGAGLEDDSQGSPQNFRLGFCQPKCTISMN